MKKFLRTFILISTMLLLILFSSCGKDNTETTNEDTKTTSKAELKVSDFFPFIENTHMVYNGYGNEYAPFETYVEYIKGSIMQVRNINAGTISAVVYEIKNGELKRLLSKGEVYYRYDFTSFSDNNEEILLKEPIKKGTSWTLKNKDKRSITSIDKSITTPAGTYNTIEVTTEGTYSITMDYYAKDIGLVKRVFQSKEVEGEIVSELEKIEKDVPYKESINIYFPDFDKDKLAYVNTKLEYYTNQDAKDVIETAMKNIPEGSGLSKVISDNTKILNIKLDDENEKVVVDFSSNLITEMNAGTTLESMILQSITNTFGGYFQRQKVEITIEGNPYSSGHILMQAGECFTVNTENCYEYK